MDATGAGMRRWLLLFMVAASAFAAPHALAQFDERGVVAPESAANPAPSTQPTVPVEGRRPREPKPPVVYTPPPPAPAPCPVCGDELAAYVEGLFAGQVNAGRIAGATVVIFRDGREVLKRGYGFADLDSRTPVDPDKTLFRVASVSKLFTALAVMQQVEKGRADLSADVNSYLRDFKLKPFGPEPVTLAHLLTHTGGFDDRFLQFASAIDKPVESLEQHLARRMPPRVMPAGRVFSYSNYGYALAGQIASLQGGKDFRALVQEGIFDPLGMNQSRFGFSDAGPSADMATPYERTPTGLRKGSFDRMAPYPAGDLITSGADMSRFMGAMLGSGGGVVSPQTLAVMLDQQAPATGTNAGWGYGFALGKSNGISWFGHGGAWPGFAAELRLARGTNSGFFIALNSDNSFDVVQPIVNALSDRLWRGEVTNAGTDPATAAENAKQLAGTYIPNRRTRSDFFLISAAQSGLVLTAKEDGTLEGRSGLTPRVLRFRPIADNLWEEELFRWQLAPYRADGVIPQGAILGAFPFERASFAHDLGRQQPLLMLSLLVCVLTVFGWSLGFVYRRLYGQPDAAVTSPAREVGFAGALLVLIFLGGFFASLAGLRSHDVLTGNLGLLPVLLLLPYALVFITAIAALLCLVGFGSSVRARLAQGGYLLLVLSFFFVLWFAWAWNLHWAMQ
ncbi:MAG TPA: hypothetical protein DCL48_15165 [Alphaproteobacteria bacterium]|nr:hypothetical protein [Alphaproteobacteria bacterium]